MPLVNSCFKLQYANPYMLRKGNQSFPFRKAVQFFWKVKGKQYFLEKVERNWKGKVQRGNFLVPFLFWFNRLKKPWHYKFPKGKTIKDLYLCEGHIKSSQHKKCVWAVPLCLFSFSFLLLLFCQKNWKMGKIFEILFKFVERKGNGKECCPL